MVTDPCPACSKEHPWRGDPALGFPVVICPSVRPGTIRLLNTPPEPPQEPRCSRCGKTESEDVWGRLVDVRVTTANGEEGYGDVTQLLCDEDLATILDGLRALGFAHHDHGGINFLEDQTCQGSGHVVGGVCPTPQEADPYDGTFTIPPPLS